MMGELLGLVGALMPIIAGAYSILLFGRIYKPKVKNEKEAENLEQLIEKRGKLMIGLGVFLVIFGIFSLLKFLL